MKKLLSLILVAMLCVCMLASCSVVDTVKGWFGMNEPQEEITYDLPSAVEYLRTMYIDKATVTPNDYELVAQVMVAAVPEMQAAGNQKQSRSDGSHPGYTSS